MTSLTTHPNAERITGMLKAFAEGDLEGALAVWSDDAVMHVPGKNTLSGTYRGRDQLTAVLKRFAELSGGTLRLEPVDILADDGHVVAILHATARVGDKHLDVTDANAFKVDRDGRFCECWWLPDDQAAFDRFWS